MPLPIDPPPPPGRALQARAGRSTRAAAWAAALLLAACASGPEAPPPAADPAPLPPPLPAPVPAPAPAPAQPPAPDPAALADTAARRLLAYHERLRELPQPQLALEYLRLAEATPPSAPGPEQAGKALELALLLGLRQQTGDLVRALGMLEPHTRAASPWQGLARLLHAKLQDQRRLEEQLERQGQQLRDQQRRIEQLASQLEALKAIERSLNTPRPATAPAPRPAP